MKAMRNPRFEDFEYELLPETSRDCFAWFGNGLTVAQLQFGFTTDYLDLSDKPPVINHEVDIGSFSHGVYENVPVV